MEIILKEKPKELTGRIKNFHEDIYKEAERIAIENYNGKTTYYYPTIVTIHIDRIIFTEENQHNISHTTLFEEELDSYSFFINKNSVEVDQDATEKYVDEILTRPKFNKNIKKISSKDVSLDKVEDFNNKSRKKFMEYIGGERL